MLGSYLVKYVWVLNLLLIALLAYKVADIVGYRVKDRLSPLASARASVSSSGTDAVVAASRMASRRDYDLIIKRNVFGIENPYSSYVLGSQIDIGSMSPSTLKVELLATVVRSETEVKAEEGTRRITKQRRSTAIIKNVVNGKIRSYREGDKIDIIDGQVVRLLKVDNCVAVLERAGRKESIRCKKKLQSPTRVASISAGRRRKGKGTDTKGSARRGVAKVGENSYEIDRKFLDEKLSNLNDILTQARVIPQKDGLKFLAVRRNSVFYEIGIRNGDTLHMINNVPLNNIQNALGLFEELKHQTSFKIDLTRRGKRITQEYVVR